MPVRQRHLGARRDDVDVVGLDALPVGGLQHGDGGRARQELGENALVYRVEVLHEHVGEAAVHRETAEQLREGFEATR